MKTLFFLYTSLRKIIMAPRTQLTLIAYGFFVILVFAGIWWFRFVWLTQQSVKAYTSTAASFSVSEHLESLNFTSTMAKALIVHFIDPQCPCSRYSLPFIEKLESEYRNTVDQIRVSAENPGIHFPQAVKNLRSLLPASPATAIWNTQGELVYFGPYSTGAYCGEGQDMVRYILDLLASKQAVLWVDQESQGCMCIWRQAS